MDKEKLLKALDNEDNEILFHFTTKTLKELNFKVLRELNLTPQDLRDLMEKVNGYMYIDDIKHLKYGSYLRWICVNDPNDLYLNQGGTLCEIKEGTKGVTLVCKNFTRRHFSITFDECLVFQRLTDQEKVLLSALDHLSTK